MARTAEQILQKIVGSQTLQLAQLIAQVEKLIEEATEVEKAKQSAVAEDKPVVKKDK